MIGRVRIPSMGSVLLLVAACVAGPGGVPPAGRALPAPWTPKDSRITLRPPGPATTALKAVDAYALCKSGVADCDPSNPTEIDLAAATDPDFGTADAKGNFQQRLRGTLVWAIVWKGINCPPSAGGPLVDPSAEASAASGMCDKLALIDATSGEFLYSYLFPHE
jgi:hypothetical protein